jgi:hypothetical protein
MRQRNPRIRSRARSIRNWVGTISSIGRCKTFLGLMEKEFVYKSKLRTWVGEGL